MFYEFCQTLYVLKSVFWVQQLFSHFIFERIRKLLSIAIRTLEFSILLKIRKYPITLFLHLS
jgi:hypothetical protein